MATDCTTSIPRQPVGSELPLLRKETEAMNPTDQIIQSRLGLKVERYHSIPHQGSYSVAAHTSGMMLLAWYLFRADFAALAPVIMAHDIPEAWVGDIPAPTLRHVPGMRDSLMVIEDRLLTGLDLPSENSLTGAQYAMYKACDRLEFYLWCLEQKAQGNRYVEEPILFMNGQLQASTLPGASFMFFQRLQGMDIVPKQASVLREVMGS